MSYTRPYRVAIGIAFPRFIAPARAIIWIESAGRQTGKLFAIRANDSPAAMNRRGSRSTSNPFFYQSPDPNPRSGSASRSYYRSAIQLESAEHLNTRAIGTRHHLFLTKDRERNGKGGGEEATKKNEKKKTYRSIVRRANAVYTSRVLRCTRMLRSARYVRHPQSINVRRRGRRHNG